ncbi:MAG TPA: tonB-system energizer ExbB [Alcanivoracaceae bacterium]|nr:tonB-system energizer ExbB [Alcanivoracaceae bacterium]
MKHIASLSLLLFLLFCAPASFADNTEAPVQAVEQTLVSTAETNVEEGAKAAAGAVTPAVMAQDLSPMGMYRGADEVVKSVMIVLLMASFLTWAVWIFKTIQLRVVRKNTQLVLTELVQAESLAAANESQGDAQGAAGALLSAARLEVELSARGTATDEGIKERVAARLERVHASASQDIRRGISVLATTGAVAPFVGLFGTVWGIMHSFVGIAESQTTNLAVVAPGIAEALLATAMGLVAAIPAVVFYNYFSRAIAAYRGDLSDIVASLLILVSRDLDRQQQPTSNSGQ